MAHTGESRSTARERVLVAVSGSPQSDRIIATGKRLADLFGAPLEVVFIETADAATRKGRAAEALGLAARLGATIATIPAATVWDGVDAHLQSARVTHVVLGRRSGGSGFQFGRRSLLDHLAIRHPGIVFHVLPTDVPPACSALIAADLQTGLSFRNMGYAALLVATTLAVGELLKLFISSRSLDLLFLFPVIAVAARSGFLPALFSVALSVLCYNYFLLTPSFSFDPRAPQNVVMTGVLSVVAIYTSIVTGRMRGRALLSDRSARESASIAALGQQLTRAADWQTSAAAVCEHVRQLLDLHTVMFREVGGHLVQTACSTDDATLSPIDHMALEAAWTTGNRSGAGTELVSAANWQFQPLKTSLGILAVLGLARDDGRDPVRADQQVLLSTLIAQAALAHERLRLEDEMRKGTAV